MGKKYRKEDNIFKPQISFKRYIPEDIPMMWPTIYCNNDIYNICHVVTWVFLSYLVRMVTVTM